MIFIVSENISHTNNNRLNRFSLDLSDNVFSNPSKDWSPFYADPADVLLEEAVIREKQDNTIRRAYAEEKRVRFSIKIIISS